MKERTAEAVGDRGINAGWQKLIRLPTTKQPRGVSSFLVLILKENVAPANQMQRKQECVDDTRLSKMHVIMRKLDVNRYVVTAADLGNERREF